MTLEPALVVDAACRLGEGPVWHPDEESLYWVDIDGRAVHRHDPASGDTDRFGVDDDIGVIGLWFGSTWIAAGRRGIYRLDLPAGSIVLYADPEGHLPDSRFNDGKIDRQGRFWAGTLTFEGARSWLYRMGLDLGLEVVDGPFTICNGIGWSPAGDRMYFVDSMRYVIHRYDFDLATGAVADRTDLIRFDPADGIPDGLTVDVAGDIWCAMYGAGSVLRIDPDGEVREAIAIPVSRPTSCAFGGPDLDVLYVTSAREGIPEDRLRREPLAGGVFSVRPGARGRPEPRFGAPPPG